MTRQSLVANLIYLILTYVQGTLWSSQLMATPYMQMRPAQTNSVDSKDGSSDLSRMESLSISEAKAEGNPEGTEHTFDISTLRPFAFQAGYYGGPYQQEKISSVYTLGFDIQYAIDPSDKFHLGLLISDKSNPFIYLARESYLRNYWKYLKSWSYLAELEIDATQGLGAFFSLNQYSGGVGVTFSLSPRVDLLTNLLPLSTRGPSAEIRINYLAF